MKQHVVIFRVSTGENWQEVMLSCSADVSTVHCDSRVTTSGTCGSDFAYIFFPTFLFFSSMLVSLQVQLLGCIEI